MLAGFQDHAFDPADIVDVGDDALALRAAERAHEDGVAGRDRHELAGTLALVREHAAPEEAQLHALEARTRRLSLRRGFLSFQSLHGDPDWPT
jgi:hypothetical protein